MRRNGKKVVQTTSTTNIFTLAMFSLRSQSQLKMKRISEKSANAIKREVEDQGNEIFFENDSDFS